MKYKQLIESMTLSEKCGLLSGRDIWSSKPIERLGIPSITLSDGPTGLRKQIGSADHLGLNASLPATCWPTASAVACSWNPELCEKIGEYLGDEAVALDVNVILGPGMNTKRNPLCGRNFEYFSEDPYLSGKLAAGYIRGIQSKGVSACPKHYAANNQELDRMTSNSVVDERTLREIYLTNFEIAVKEANPKFIMTSYNRVNDIYANEHKQLLSEILVEEWGFSGAVVTDWGGSNDHVDGVMAGSHLEMPGTAGDSDRQLEQAVKDGRIPESVVDSRVNEFLNVVFSLMPEEKSKKQAPFDKDAHHKMAEVAAAETIVLLKNEENILPLQAQKKVAIIGDFAENPRYQGAGSSMVNPTKLDNLLEALKDSELVSVGYAKGFLRNGKNNSVLQSQALELAEKADVVLYYMGLPEVFETEGLDRTHMKIPENQILLLEALRQKNEKIVVLLAAGSPIEMPWIDKCKALVHGHLGGQAGAGALIKVITGEINPSGKLAETYPILYEDSPTSEIYPCYKRNVEYIEGPYIGYRYFETVEKSVRFPFGYGLSYTTFKYSQIELSEDIVSFILHNTGKRDGAEIAQVYIGASDGHVFRPTKELKGFKKVFLKAGESKKVSIPLDDKVFRYFNVKTNSWEIETARYDVMVGASVSDIRLSATLQITGSDAICPYSKEEIPNYYTGSVKQISRKEFSQILGRELPKEENSQDRMLEMNDAMCRMVNAKSGLARLVYRIMTRLKDRSIKKGKPDLNILFMYHIPFRGIAKLMNGMVTMEMAEALLVMVNGRFFKGFSLLIRGHRNARRAIKKSKG